VTSRTNAAQFSPANICEEVRRDVFERYAKELYEGGLRYGTTLDQSCRSWRARPWAGLVTFDEQQGWRGAMSKLDISGDWGVKLPTSNRCRHFAMADAVVLETSEPVRANWFPARPRTGWRRCEGAADRESSRSTRQVGKGCVGVDAFQDADRGVASAFAGDVIYADP